MLPPQTKHSPRTIIRLLNLIARHRYSLYDASAGRLSFPGKAQDMPCDPGLMKYLTGQGLLADRSGKFMLTGEAKTFLRRKADPDDGFRSQHLTLKPVAEPGSTPSHSAPLRIDPESPLAWLAKHKTKTGAAFLTTAQIAAGERLRADYGYAQFTPGLGMRWSPVAGNGSNAARGPADATDGALDARERLNKALTSVGPEFADALFDVCCLLKSATVLEKEQGWPARSGKVVLRLGLEALARHYGLTQVARGKVSAAMRHAGASDYRPRL